MDLNPIKRLATWWDDLILHRCRTCHVPCEVVYGDKPCGELWAEGHYLACPVCKRVLRDL